MIGTIFENRCLHIIIVITVSSKFFYSISFSQLKFISFLRVIFLFKGSTLKFFMPSIKSSNIKFSRYFSSDMINNNTKTNLFHTIFN
mmetsp:Transcript_20744/g.2782  ORF Transcript_20744/g.2782 Transcript_20744/m.2782 type:complete len:87 (+) Transcript_20744:301-561(+)